MDSIQGELAACGREVGSSCFISPLGDGVAVFSLQPFHRLQLVLYSVVDRVSAVGRNEWLVDVGGSFSSYILLIIVELCLLLTTAGVLMRSTLTSAPLK